MDIKRISDNNLLVDLKTLVADEKKLLKKVLDYLEEVENRKLHFKEGFGSMYAFCTDFLNYTPQEAQTRINAMRLAKDVPELKEKIESGKISLSVAARVQAHLIKETRAHIKPTITIARSLVAAVEGKSVRESEMFLFERFPHHETIESVRIKQVGKQTKRLEVNLPEEVFEKLEQVRNLRSNANPYGDWAVLFNVLAELALDKWDPGRQYERRQKRERRESRGSTEHEH
jgi:hypothetical protein